MTRHWQIAEKVIAITIVIWGITTSMAIVWYMEMQFYIIFGDSGVDWDLISFPKILKNYLLRFIQPILAVVAGILLLLEKKSGWLLSVVTSGVFSFSMLMLPFQNDQDIAEYTVLFVAIGLVFFGAAGCLVSNPIRSKYSPSKNTWIVIGVLFVLLLLTRIYSR